MTLRSAQMGGDSDPSNKVKIALSMEMTKLFDVMKDAEVSVDPNETLLAMCFKLVDANEQVDSALLSVMESLKDIAPLVEKNPGNAEKLLGLLQKFVDPASQTVSPENWRLRRAVILAMAPVTKSLGGTGGCYSAELRGITAVHVLRLFKGVVLSG